MRMKEQRGWCKECVRMIDKKREKHTFLFLPEVNELCKSLGVNTSQPHINLTSILTLSLTAIRQWSISISYNFYYNSTEGCIGNVNTLHVT